MADVDSRKGPEATLSRESPGRILCRGLIVLFISGFGAATLVRLAPGFGIDETVMDTRLSARSIRALEREHAEGQNPFSFYVHYLAMLLGGSAGRSTVYGQPVRQLIGERAGITIRSVTVGLTIGWGLGVVLGAASAVSRSASVLVGAMTISGALLSIPSALIAILCLLLRLPPDFALGAVILPRVFPHVYEQLRDGLAAPHVVMARARGVSGTRVFFYHVVPTAIMPILALGGVSVTLAFGAAIPIEAMADSPGIGQLAWRAALGRDVPVLVSITLLLTAITVFINVLADIVLRRLGQRSA